jgi:hypothetical protein
MLLCFRMQGWQKTSSSLHLVVALLAARGRGEGVGDVHGEHGLVQSYGALVWLE